MEVHTCYALTACRRANRSLIRVLTMFNRLTKVLKEVCFYLFWGYVVLLHLIFFMVVVGLLGFFGLYV